MNSWCHFTYIVNRSIITSQNEERSSCVITVDGNNILVLHKEKWRQQEVSASHEEIGFLSNVTWTNAENESALSSTLPASVWWQRSTLPLCPCGWWQWADFLRRTKPPPAHSDWTRLRIRTNRASQINSDFQNQLYYMKWNPTNFTAVAIRTDSPQYDFCARCHSNHLIVVPQRAAHDLGIKSHPVNHPVQPRAGEDLLPSSRLFNPEHEWCHILTHPVCASESLLLVTCSKRNPTCNRPQTGHTPQQSSYDDHIWFGPCLDQRPDLNNRAHDLRNH